MADEQHIEQTPQKRKFSMKIAKQMHTKGRTYKEIAEHFGTTEQRVKNEFYHESQDKKEAEANKRPRSRPPGAKNKSTIAKEQLLAERQGMAMSGYAPLMREDKAQLNQAAAIFLTECLTLRGKVNIENINSLYGALGEYLKLCQQTGMPITPKSMQLALGVSAQQMASWRKGTRRGDDEEYKRFAEMAQEIAHTAIQVAGATGALDKILTIFWEKAFMGVVEAQKPEAEQDDPLGNKMTAKEIVAKYSDLLPSGDN